MKKQFKKIIEDIVIFLLPYYLKILMKTSRVIYLNKEYIEPYLEEKKPFILSLWHCNAFTGPILIRDMDLYILISQSRDGELINRIVKRFNNHSVRGSSSKGGIQALKVLIKIAREGKRILITPDGPRGPAFKLQPGIITLASQTGIPIIPFHHESIKQKKAKSWDAMRIPALFNTIIVSYGEPIFIPPNLDEQNFEHYRQLVENRMMENLYKAEKKREELIQNK
ncbi:MAG: lysophospholipid acyltransferase family protein [Leptospiraceae bacterium]|jgi:lysophospholipid acyltransferase (LPLAT)-like uncharacterized protein|nr:lysophospholipid acyltransferase family protein [Leptospiraceae bacterium]